MITEIYESGQFGPTMSAIAVALSSAMLVAFAIATFRRARRRRALAASEAAMLDPDHPLRAGGLREGEIVLSGVVEHADDHDVAVRIDVTQSGSESESSGTWSYRWTEIDRKIVVRPFYLRLADGVKVRVLAPPDVEVADALDRKVLISRTKRVLSAELIPGEALHAQGLLERGEMAIPGAEAGYRDVEREWQLVPARGRMLLSSEPLGKGLAERAAFHRRYFLRALFVLAALQVSFANYYARAVSNDEPATVVSHEVSTYEDSDGKRQLRYDLTLRLTKNNELGEVEISEDDFARVRKSDVVAVRHGVSGWQLGGGSTIGYLHAGAALFFAIIVAISYGARRGSSRPWFKRTVEHSGSGRLPDVKS